MANLQIILCDSQIYKFDNLFVDISGAMVVSPTSPAKARGALVPSKGRIISQNIRGRGAAVSTNLSGNAIVKAVESGNE